MLNFCAALRWWDRGRGTTGRKNLKTIQNDSHGDDFKCGPKCTNTRLIPQHWSPGCTEAPSTTDPRLLGLFLVLTCSYWWELLAPAWVIMYGVSEGHGLPYCRCNEGGSVFSTVLQWPSAATRGWQSSPTRDRGERRRGWRWPRCYRRPPASLTRTPARQCALPVARERASK